MNNLPDTGYLREKQILGDKKARPPVPPIIPISHSSWWAGVKSGRYPQPIKLGPRTTVWNVASIRALIDNPNPIDQKQPGHVKPTTVELAGQA